MATLYWRPLAAGHAWGDSVWSTLDSGAAGTLAPPTSADDANFSSNDNSSCSVNAGATCRNLACTNGTGYTGILATAANMTIAGSMALSAGMLFTGVFVVLFTSSSAAQPITTNGVQVPQLTFTGTGGWTLQDALTLNNANGAITVTLGTLNTNAKTVTCGFFVSTSGTRTLTLTGSTINITGTSGTPINVTSTGTLTLTATGATVNVNGGAAGVSLALLLAANWNCNLNITGAGLWTATANGTFNSISYTSTSNKTDRLLWAGSPTINAAGSLTYAGNSVVNRAFVSSNALGTQRSISVPSGATVSITNCDFQDINMTGIFSTGATASSIGDALGNTWGWSSVQPDPSVSLSLTGTGTINWSTAGVWSTGKIPLPQDDVSLGSSSTATTLTADMPRLGRNIDASAYLKTLSFASTPNTIFGNITLPVGAATLSGTQTLTLAGRGAQTITSNGKNFTMQTNIDTFGGSYTLQDNFSLTSATLTHRIGLLDFGSNTVNVLAFATAGTGSSTRELRATSASVLSITLPSGVVVNSTNVVVLTSFFAAIKLTGNNTTTQTFNGSGLSWPSLNWSSTTSTGTLIITGANTFNNLTIDGTTARTVQFPASVTTTINNILQTNAGTGGALVTFSSSIPGTKATLSSASPLISLDYLSINDSAATGGAAWYAGSHSNDNGTNTGWNFRSPVPVAMHHYMTQRAA